MSMTLSFYTVREGRGRGTEKHSGVNVNVLLHCARGKGDRGSTVMSMTMSFCTVREGRANSGITVVSMTLSFCIVQEGKGGGWQQKHSDVNNDVLLHCMREKWGQRERSDVSDNVFCTSQEERGGGTAESK